MQTTVKVTVVFLGKLGSAVLENMPSSERPAIDIFLDNSIVQQDPWPEKAVIGDNLAEEVIFVVAEVEELDKPAFQKLRQDGAAQQNRFVILVTVAPGGEMESAVAEKRQETLAFVDSVLVLPAAASENPSQDSAILEAIAKTIKYLSSLLLEVNIGEVSIDFEDVKTVLQSSETGAVGLGRAAGGNRAMEAVEKATSLPFMAQAQLTNAKRVLLQIGSGNSPELEMDELTEMTDAIQEKCGDDSEVIFGHYTDEKLGAEIELFLIVVQ